MLTLHELKQITDKSGNRKQRPTVKQLRESGLEIARERLGRDAEITVYRDGCVVYQAGSHSTVFFLHSCRDYCYISDGNEVHLPEQFFDKERWYLRLVLEGEDRLNRNLEERERNRNVSYSSISEEWIVMEDLAESALEKLAKQETWEEIMRMLTEKQRTVIRRYYLQEKTQTQIAKELGISRLAVRGALFRAVSKIRKKYPLCSSCLSFGTAGSGATQ